MVSLKSAVNETCVKSRHLYRKGNEVQFAVWKVDGRTTMFRRCKVNDRWRVIGRACGQVQLLQSQFSPYQMANIPRSTFGDAGSHMWDDWWIPAVGTSPSWFQQVGRKRTLDLVQSQLSFWCLVCLFLQWWRITWDKRTMGARGVFVDRPTSKPFFKDTTRGFFGTSVISWMNLQRAVMVCGRTCWQHLWLNEYQCFLFGCFGFEHFFFDVMRLSIFLR